MVASSNLVGPAFVKLNSSRVKNNSTNLINKALVSIIAIQGSFLVVEFIFNMTRISYLLSGLSAIICVIALVYLNKELFNK